MEIAVTYLSSTEAEPLAPPPYAADASNGGTETEPLAPIPRAADIRDRSWFSSLTSWGSSGAVVALLIVLIGLPLGFVLGGAFADGGRPIVEVVTDPQFPKIMGTTIVLGIGSVIIAVVLGTLLAWCAHRLPPGRSWLGFLPLLPLVLPPMAIVVGYAFLFSPRVGYINSLLRMLPWWSDLTDGPTDLYTVFGIVLITGVIYTSFVFLFVKTALSQMHQDLIDAASAAGAGPITVFFRIVVPLLRPALVYGAITVLVMSLGQVTVPLYLGRQNGINVLSTAVLQELNGYPRDLGVVAAWGLPILLAGMAAIIVERNSLRDGKRFVTVGARGARPLRPAGPLGQAFIGIFAAATIVLPLIALIIVAFQPFWSATVVPADFTLQNFQTVLTDPALLAAVRNSVVFAGGAVLITVPLSYICAQLIYRSRNGAAIAVRILSTAPLGIPAVIFGIGFLTAFILGPLKLYGNGFGLVVVYTVLMIPFTTRLMLGSLANIGRELDDAAAVNGAGILRRTVLINVPLAKSGLAAAAALVLMMMTHEFSASVLVRSPTTEVMGSVLYNLWNFGSYSETAVMALVMCVVTTICVSIAIAFGGSGALSQQITQRTRRK